MAIQSSNPATGEVLESFEPLTAAELEAKLARALESFRVHRATSFAFRAERMMRAAEVLDAEKEAFGRLMTIEMGKPIAAAESEVEKCAWVCRYYADNAESFLATEPVETGARHSEVRYRPLGPVLAVMPWNFPFWQVFRFAAPALMAGNTALLKHASNVPRCALALEEIFRRAGFDEGVFQTLLVESDAVEGILKDERVVAATLTGSTAAGSAVARTAGEQIKKTVLELGGSDPFIVMPTADLDDAVRTAVASRTVNNGQSCIAAKRFIVHGDVYDRFVEGFVAGLQRLRVGDPLDRETEVGPLATAAIAEEVHDQVRRTMAAGARLLTGGDPAGGTGNYYPPTALDRIPEGSPADCEEIFGPVAAIFRVEGIDEAIEQANRTPFGLGSSVWTNAPAERERFIEEIEAGQVYVNAMVASDPRLPFGGVKGSGYGRELGRWGIREFVNVKSVWIGGSPPAGAE